MNRIIKLLYVLGLRKLAFKLELSQWEKFKRTDEYLAAEAELDAYLESRCYCGDCWEDAGPTGLCVVHQDEDDLLAWQQFCEEQEAEMERQRLEDEELDRYNDEYGDCWEDDLEDDDDNITTTEVYNRAYTHFGNHELAREAAELYPGDFI